MRAIPKSCIDLVKKFEGRMLQSYRCPAGVWTIGYGATGPEVGPGMRWTIKQAEDDLLERLGKFGADVDELVKVPMTDNEYGALVCFAYNVGIGALRGSTLLRVLNEGKREDAAEQFARWNKAGGKVLEGLTARRAAERTLFLKKD